MLLKDRQYPLDLLTRWQLRRIEIGSQDTESKIDLPNGGALGALAWIVDDLIPGDLHARELHLDLADPRQDALLDALRQGRILEILGHFFAICQRPF